jgi:pimeloyl-ACP methyl ester carboxylesterase
MSFVRLVAVGWLLLGVGDLAAAAPCTKPDSECAEYLTVPTGGGRGLVYRTAPLNTRNDAVTRVLVVVHGAGRDADSYFRHALAGAFLAGALEDTLIISPRFGSNDGPGCRDSLAPGELNWKCSGSENWRTGGRTVDDSAVTSYDFADEILRKVARKDIFPNLRLIVFVGHSAGGQFVSRYQMSNQVHDRLGIPVRYVVSNPSSYAYLDALRPTRWALPADVVAAAPGYIAPQPVTALPPFVEFDDARNCTTFNSWPYGLQSRIGYSSRITDAQLKAQLSRPTTYLLSELDILPIAGFDASCSAMAQGPTRFARGLAYAKHATERHGARHLVVRVPACGHNARCVFTSEQALPVIFPAK